MDTEVIHIDPRADHFDACRKAVDVLTGGGLVAFPTETVYGVGVRADHREGVERLRSVKSRKADNAFTVHVSSPDAADALAPDLPELARRLMRKAWPGPLTLVVPVEDPAGAPAMAGLNGSAAATIYCDNTVGFRCPDDPVAQTLLRGVTAPVVAASANLHGHAPPHTGMDALKELDGKVDLLIDSGRTKYARPSTIIRVIGPTYELLREGVFDGGSIRRLSALRILFVCTGNTCRSPMAAGLTRKLIAEKRRCNISDLAERGVTVASAGTGGGGGGASPHAVRVMEKRGVDVSDHVSTSLSREQIVQADYVFAMTRSHLDAIVRIAPLAKDRAALLVDEENVRDPIGGDEEEYERCARMIESGVRARLQEANL